MVSSVIAENRVADRDLTNGSGSVSSSGYGSAVTLRMLKKKLFFSYNLPAGTLSSVLKFLLFLKKSIYEKRKVPGAGCVSLTNGAGSGS
jgi:hypothetical protein